VPWFFVAINKDHASLPAGVQFFRSYHHDRNPPGQVPKDDYEDVEVLRAARATAAAPMYFKAQRIERKKKYYM
jgi:hypothetical protein